MPMTVGEAYDKKHGKKPKPPVKPGDKKEPKVHNMPLIKDDKRPKKKAPNKYKTGPLPPKAGSSFTDRDLGKGGSSYEKPKIKWIGSVRHRYDNSKGKYVPYPEK